MIYFEYTIHYDDFNTYLTLYSISYSIISPYNKLPEPY